MLISVNFSRKFEYLEKIFPKNVRLPVRYYGQKFLRALEPEMELLNTLVPSNKIAIDIGANKGVYAYALSKRAQLVYGFEPIIELCSYINSYGSKKIIMHNCALGSEPGNLRLHIPRVKGKLVTTRASLIYNTDDCEIRNISVSTLDDYKIKEIGFIKIDVEGVELSVLTGSTNTLLESMPNILIEVNWHQHSPSSFMEVFEFLYSIGYNSYVYSDGTLKSCLGNELVYGPNYYNYIFTSP